MTSRSAHIHSARVYLAQAQAFRLRGDTFALTLLAWAANARRRAMACREPVQRDFLSEAVRK